MFLGIVMMPFYYGAKVRSVPEYLRLRFGQAAHAFNAATFAIATVLIGGVNLFALALIIHLLLGWSVTTAILVAAAIVLFYIVLGGLTSAIYNEVLQFFVIVAALLPLTLVALHAVGGFSGLEHRIKAFKPLGNAGLHAWQGLGIHHVTNPLAANWIGVVFGLGFVLSFGYWTTNFAEVQRALSARNLSAARRTPLIGAYPKIFLPFGRRCRKAWTEGPRNSHCVIYIGYDQEMNLTAVTWGATKVTSWPFHQDYCDELYVALHDPAHAPDDFDVTKWTRDVAKVEKG